MLRTRDKFLALKKLNIRNFILTMQILFFVVDDLQ